MCTVVCGNIHAHLVSFNTYRVPDMMLLFEVSEKSVAIPYTSPEFNETM